MWDVRHVGLGILGAPVGFRWHDDGLQGRSWTTDAAQPRSDAQLSTQVHEESPVDPQSAQAAIHVARGCDMITTRMELESHGLVPLTLRTATVKVALAWDSAVTSGGNATASTLTTGNDLDVTDSAGRLVAVSASWDNSCEIVEVAASAGESSEIAIRRWSGTDSVRQDVAWTVSGTMFRHLEIVNLLEVQR